MSARALPALALFLALWPGSAHAIDCSSADAAVASASGYSSAYLICSEPRLAALESESRQLEDSVGSGMPPAQRKILAEAIPDGFGIFFSCSRSRADCIAELEGGLRGRIRFLRGEPMSGPGTGEQMVLHPFHTKLTSDGTPVARVLQRFANPSAPGARAYNEIVDTIIARSLETSGEDANYIVRTLTPHYASDRLMSVGHEWVHIQREGGHDPVYGISNFNIDMRSGKLVDLAELFPPVQLAEMKDNCVKQLVRQIRDRRAADTSAEATEYSPQGPDEVSGWMSDLFMSSGSWSFREGEAVVTFDEATMDVPGENNCRFSAEEIRRRARAGAPVP
jgi:hypothetical protein